MDCKSYNEQGQQINYHCDYKISTQYGNYEWCGGKNFGYKLRNSSAPNQYTEKQMIQIDFKLNQELAKNITHIEIYDDNWGLLGYTFGMITNNQWTWFAPIDITYSNKELTVIFTRPKVLTEQEKERLSLRPLARTPMAKVFGIKITVPEFISCEQTDVCCICLKQKPNHITQCAHKFHNSCLFEYLEKANLIEKNNCASCKINHVEKIVCPVCDTKKINKLNVLDTVFNLCNLFNMGFN